MNTIIEIIITGLLVPILPLLTAYVISYINKKKVEADNAISNANVQHYIFIASEAVKAVVSSISQTTVDVLKQNGTFNDKAAKEAFELAKINTINILGVAGVEILTDAFGDFDTFIEAKIEQIVKASKVGTTFTTVNTTVENNADTTISIG